MRDELVWFLLIYAIIQGITSCLMCVVMWKQKVRVYDDESYRIQREVRFLKEEYQKICEYCNEEPLKNPSIIDIHNHIVKLKLRYR